VRRLYPEFLADVDAADAYRLPEGRHLRLNMIASVDGAATVDGRSGPLGTASDRELFALLRALTDVILVGASTAVVEGYRPARLGPEREALRVRQGRSPTPPIAVVSGRLSLDPSGPLFGDPDRRSLVVTAASAPPARAAAFAEVADVIVAGRDTVCVPDALEQLAARGWARVLCEGGPTLFGAVLAAGCVDELCLTVSPVLAGGPAARIVSGLADPRPVRLRHILEDAGALFTSYEVA
jgi:riboflavin biosynthesis pyrimidine reductase